MAPTGSVRPVVFVGSSTVGPDAAHAVQQQLQSLRNVAQVRIWNEMVDSISQSILESLVSKLPTFDFGVLISRQMTQSDLAGKTCSQFAITYWLNSASALDASRGNGPLSLRLMMPS